MGQPWSGSLTEAGEGAGVGILTRTDYLMQQPKGRKVTKSWAAADFVNAGRRRVQPARSTDSPRPPRYADRAGQIIRPW